MADGREFLATTVISDAGARTTYDRLLEDHPATATVRTEVQALPPSPGHLSLYVGLDVTSAAAGLPKANLWVHPTHDHDANWRRFATDPEAPMSLYLSFPSAKDPTFDARLPGRSTVEILTFVPYKWFAPWERTRGGEEHLVRDPPCAARQGAQSHARKDIGVVALPWHEGAACERDRVERAAAGEYRTAAGPAVGLLGSAL